MGRIDIFIENDVQSIAELHNKVFLKDEAFDAEGLQKYYRDVFFKNPWYDDKFPSFVYRADEGRVVGFIGVIARKMRFRGELINVAVTHRLMVDPDGGYPFAAAQLVRRVLCGQQDLSFSDGANDMGRKFWEGMGGSTALIYSMNWIRPLKPCSYAIHILSKQKGRDILSAILGPGALIVDSLGAAKLVQATLSPNHKSIEADNDLLFDCMTELSKHYILCPEYNLDNWKWLMQFLRSNTHRGAFRAAAVYKGEKELLGVYVYYLNTHHIGEVMLLLARKDSREQVLRHLFAEAKKEKAVCLWGRMEPRFLSCFGDNKCLFKRGSWALVHAKRPEIVDMINRGDAYLTALEGELWLRSPIDRL
jgi:hypothetical protein